MEPLSSWLEQAEFGFWGWVGLGLFALLILGSAALGLFRLGLFILAIGQQYNNKQREDFERRSN